MTRIRALLVDDEEPARELLRALLAKWPEVEIVGEADDGAVALDLIRKHAPDVVFLDVQMPRMTGFDVVAALAEEDLPLIVFATAYDQYALRAFEVSACDYLLKPFDAERLTTTMRRVFAQREAADRGLSAALRSLLAHLREPAIERIVVKSDGRHLFLNADEIEWIEALGKDIRIHLTGSALVIRESRNSIERRLNGARFLRVHRSALVNRAQVREMQPWFKGDYVLILRDGTRIVSGRTYRAAVHRLIERTRGQS
jgi:two-component system LytT family response regulator